MDQMSGILSPSENAGQSPGQVGPEVAAGNGVPAVGTPHVAIYTTQSLDRRLARVGRRDLLRKRQVAADYDQTPWSLMYKALTDSLGASPSTFQLIYPFTSWNWPTQTVGFMSGVQYDFCSTSPQWSAVGDYSSSGDRINQSYQEFLNVIVASTENPTLRAKIAVAANALTDATNNYTTAYNQAISAYGDDAEVVDNVPSFTKWLGGPAGKGYQTKISTAEKAMDQSQADYNNLVDQANTPGLSDAQNQFKNQDFYSKLNDPGLSGFPKVPYWSISQNAATWVDRIKAGEGPAGATMGFTNHDSAYDYSKTWAGGSLTIPQVFWQVRVDGKWTRVTEFESDNDLVVSVEFEAIDQIQIQPSGWYNGGFIKSHKEGPYKMGFSAYGGDGTQAVFGEAGFLGLLKTGMYVGYKPTFTIQTSQSTFSSFQEKFKVSTGLRIGPFNFTAEGGSSKAGWNASAQGKTFTGTSSSDTPLILGLSIAILPGGSAEELQAAAAEPERRGRCYRFGDKEGDVIAEGVTEEACTAMGGGSWESMSSANVITPLRSFRVTEEAFPAQEVLSGADGEEQPLGGVHHVSLLRPYNITNGGPDNHHRYRIRATNVRTHMPVDLRQMRFVGFAPFTGAARFTD